jgi:hypothetical protein
VSCAFAQSSTENIARASLISSAKASPETSPPESYTFKPASIWSGAGFAYMCATLIDEKGKPSYTDDQVDTTNIYFYKSKEKWLVATKVDSFSKSPSKISCAENTKNLSDDGALSAISQRLVDANTLEVTATCGRLNTIAQAAPGFHPSAEAKVTAKGRTWLYGAPSEHCKSDKHLVLNDYVTVYTPVNGWVYVMYINAKTGVETIAWLKESAIAYQETSKAQ